jgi:hypothetical protein
MSNLQQLFIIAAIGLTTFGLGLLAGIAIKKEYKYRKRFRLRVRQNEGESIVRNIILADFKSPNYHLMNNITIAFQDGTTQIDHILISTKGIFVIETKNYSGWIFADEKSRQWTRVHFRKKNQFQNPLRQNYKHQKAVQGLLDFLPKEYIHSIVVFTGDAEFKTPIPKGVVDYSRLTDYINTYQDDVISTNRMEFCVGRLECRRYEVTRKTDLQHLAYLERKYGNIN